MEDRRASPRRPIRCEIQCEAGTQVFEAQAFDLSENGISFFTLATLPMNSEVILRYRLSPDDPLVTARVRVRQQVGQRVGVQFLDFKHEDSARSGS
jgi:PilZ domain